MVCARLGKLIPADKKIMITFGGGSVRRNGVYDQVVKALEGRDWVEFWGIEPNPSVETVREAVALHRKDKGVPRRAEIIPSNLMQLVLP